MKVMLWSFVEVSSRNPHLILSASLFLVEDKFTADPASTSINPNGHQARVLVAVNL